MTRAPSSTPRFPTISATAIPAHEGVKLQVNAKNLFDNHKTICSAGYCYRDEGRSLFASLRYRF